MPAVSRTKAPGKAVKVIAGSALEVRSGDHVRHEANERDSESSLVTGHDDEPHIQITHFGDVYRVGPTRRIELIKSGVPAQDVARIARSMDRSKEQISKTLGLAVSTVDRKAKENQRLTTEQGERLVGLAKLIGQVQTMVEESGEPDGFNAAQWLADWLERTVPALGGRRPAEFMDTAEGRELVSKVLAMTQSGAYA
ncbi:type II RES/Xre toxin-antitoxin system antitoxin [Paraburkholderia sp.]|uniref:type II RES/Xre toxin-antitoxin system antitoxin n=1 Tax=Paraburkholderia sp. TaxID=1926495 RepID=UPI003D6DF73C